MNDNISEMFSFYNNVRYIFCASVLMVLLSACQQESLQKYPAEIINLTEEKSASLAKTIRSEVSVEVDDALDLSLWASDSLVSDPIAISIDDNGKIYYTRGSRQTSSEFDIRGHQNWITASISFQTVEDRRAFLRKTFEADNEESIKHLKDLNGDGIRDWRDLTVEKEQIWLISDQSGDGIADQSQLYLKDFHEEITDVANGVKYHNGEVFICVGPDMWRTKDDDGDGIADRTESIAHGFAVHIGFSGHGMSGATIGPDGRLWWGIGDIGMNLIDKEGKQWKYPNRGVVVRSELDGSGFEVFAMGVRNTHEFVFDKFGNLITEDNDGDHDGERERLVYLIDGSDSGWRTNWQFGKYTDPLNNDYKVWMDEKLHIPRWDGQAAYILPPIQNYINGPTGMVYNPGTALSPAWYDHFFIAEFRGSPSNSPIHAFTMVSEGAGFKLGTTKEVVKGLLPTGLDFGPDGALYFGDWINGWGTKNEGRIWKLDDPAGVNSDIRIETKNLIQDDCSTYDVSKLQSLLAHQDMRVRLKVQFELAKRGEDGLKALLNTAQSSDHQLARIHGLWGMGQIIRQESSQAQLLAPFLDDKDIEIVAQTAKLIGDIGYAGSEQNLISLTSHPNPRVVFFATEALGRTQSTAAIDAILQMIEKNDNNDTYLRMGGIIALGRIGSVEPLLELSTGNSKVKKMAAVVALRRIGDSRIAQFLNDPDEDILTETARAINDDFSIVDAIPELAKVLDRNGLTQEALLRRAINANLREGTPSNLNRLITYAQSKSAPSAMRAEAIAALSTWAAPSVFDRVDGRYRGEIQRELGPAKEALRKVMGSLFSQSNDLTLATIKAVAHMKIEEGAGQLTQLNKSHPSDEIRAQSLKALVQLTDTALIEKAIAQSLADKSPKVRAQALEVMPSSPIAENKAVELFERILKIGSIDEKQKALSALGAFQSDAAIGLLQKIFEQMTSGQLAPELQLETIESIEKQKNVELLNQLESYRSKFSEDDPLALYQESLVGGDRGAGAHLFYNSDAGQCTRCHAIFEYGGNAGPLLDGIGNRLDRRQILTSLVAPSESFAQGYEIATIIKNDDTEVTGIILERSAESTKLKVGKEDILTIANSDIKATENVPSSMPIMKDILTRRELRDLVEFLTRLN
jgi:quinoprotein glucose dehydrogenase